MKVTIECLTSDRIMRRACDMTRKPGCNPSKMPRRKIYQCEHSPCRTIRFWIEMHGIPSFVSVHLVRHKIGVEHFVESNRDDRGGAGDTEVNRLTPVNHGMDANAPALIAMSKKRLCFLSHKATVATWSRVRKAMREVDPDMADHMVPECVYRNGYCPEMRECGPGLEKVMRAYGRVPQKQRADALEAKIMALQDVVTHDAETKDELISRVRAVLGTEQDERVRDDGTASGGMTG